ncbi:SRPBCC family protein [Halospeciosus flavus]|uniref:SRPBCC family protein n=1 Tax=Halospeciosus flavus TaxID=3032283 RepID=A0ABD5Z4L1_9EURY|nr:SRPBCC family protein [Halospeciosus flavus]
MQTLEVSTVVYLPPSETYEFLLDFPRYARYSEHLARVEQEGEGGPGTTYRLHFEWWKLSYVLHTRVTDVDPPHEISWEVTKDVDAEGAWELDAVPEEAPADRTSATRVTLRVTYHPHQVDSGVLDLPRFVPFDVESKVRSLVEKEGKRVVERVVADLEGESRPVDVTVRSY